MQRLLRARRSPGLTLAGAVVLAVTGAASAGAVGTSAQAAPSVAPTARPAKAPSTTDTVIVRFAGEPLATSGKVDRRSNGKVVLTGPRTRSVSAALARQRNDFRRWLRANAPQAKITSEYDLVLNAVAVHLNGTPASTLDKGPGVAEVTPQATYHPTALPSAEAGQGGTESSGTDPDLSRIDAMDGWSAAGATSVDNQPTTWAGYGIEVGVIDTGIDIAHPCFDDDGYPGGDRLPSQGPTNDKVIVARVFNNKLHQSGYDATAIQDHGTHVAGTIACDLHTPAVVDGVDIPYDPSGVAPGARLGSYVVFPGDVESARSEDILNAMQAAARDGMDVINMSLGGGSNGRQDLLTNAVDNLDRAGIVMAVSAGNEGPGEATTGSPGMAERALTAGASTVGHYVGVPISSAAGQVTVAATGDFPVPTEDLTADLAVVEDGGELSEACEALPDSLTDAIALVSRGSCTFSTKVTNAAAAGAIGVIVVNHIPGDPIAMAGAGEIPAVMAPLSARNDLMSLDTQPVTIGADATYERSFFDDVLASFSSRGPVDVSARVKPDVVAPGVNVLSSIPLSFCDDQPGQPQDGCWAFFNGTSMASPHLAGMAAVVLAKHPEWDAWQVRSAIVNTADQFGVTQTDDPDSTEDRVQYVGAGLANLPSAVDASVALSRPSISFGAVPSGAGRTLTQTFQVTDLTGNGLGELGIEVQDSSGAGLFEATVTTPEAGPATVTVTLSLPKGAAAGATQAFLWIKEGGATVAHAPLYALVK